VLETRECNDPFTPTLAEIGLAGETISFRVSFRGASAASMQMAPSPPPLPPHLFQSEQVRGQ